MICEREKKGGSYFCFLKFKIVEQLYDKLISIFVFLSNQSNVNGLWLML